MAPPLANRGSRDTERGASAAVDAAAADGRWGGLRTPERAAAMASSSSSLPEVSFRRAL